ncbi:hypothetical protein TCA2_4487 [Paenibacillus sp. TCA20]|uniref:GNAT family N-acetyltransferase n=1 Tax=Paenibacillus urinalis TaxID=521520 RepID=A0ABY7XHB9_9BACL|nr:MULTISPECIES: hypothetical protein [Paenibacillus]WDI05178.1 hypothetical protein PUW25_25555 [Paenibacillus urinalis]GAK41995.1 hypothetical protein TCA2_4487 [Paenibacillus sp. TCA20]
MILHRNGEEYPVSFLPLTKADVKFMNKTGWEPSFDWNIYFNAPKVEVYKMVVTGDPSGTIQGAIALEKKEDHVFMLLIESSPRNRDPINKQFSHIGAHLFAFCCKRSMELGHEGFIGLKAKTKLVNYFSSLGAVPISGQDMIVSETTAQHLVNVYL